MLARGGGREVEELLSVRVEQWGEKCCVVFGIELLGWKGPPITDHGAKGAPRMQLPGHCSP
jgi:hypothetical protein